MIMIILTVLAGIIGAIEVIGRGLLAGLGLIVIYRCWPAGDYVPVMLGALVIVACFPPSATDIKVTKE